MPRWRRWPDEYQPHGRGRAGQGDQRRVHLEVDGTREKLLGLGLVHAAEALAEELSEAVKHNRPAHMLLDRLLSHELNARDERRVRTSLRLRTCRWA